MLNYSVSVAYFPVCYTLGNILGKGHQREKGLMPDTHAHSQQLEQPRL